MIQSAIALDPEEKPWKGALIYAWASDLSRKTDLLESL